MTADPEILSRIKRGLTGESLTIDSLGGIDAIVHAADAIAKSAFFDLLVPLALTNAEDDRSRLLAVLLQGFSTNQHNSTFHDALNLILDSDLLRPAFREELVPILVGRISQRETPGQDLIAAFALEALFQFALEHTPSRYRLLLIMTEFGAQEPPLFAEHAAKLVGAAYHQWKDAELLKVLTIFQNLDATAPDAAFELGMAAMADALDAQSEPEILSGLTDARELFSLSVAADSERQDAGAYLMVIDILQAVVGGADANALDVFVESLTKIVDDRRDLLSVGRLPHWLQPRCDREVEWLKLLSSVRRVLKDLLRPSWLKAATVLERVLSIYDAERTVSVGRGLHHLFAPRIEAAFVRSNGLAAHLYDLLDNDEWTSSFRVTAEHLRSSIAKRETISPRIVPEGAAFPLLNGVLPNILADDLPEGFAAIIEQRLEDHLGQRRRLANPVAQRIFNRLSDELLVSPEYRGDIKDCFDRLLLQILMFCLDRQDSDRRTAGPRIDYLRRADATEKDLQFDLREFLSGNLLEAEVLSEVEGVAAGRTDLYVYFASCRIIIELKKHEGVADEVAAAKYRDQTAAYQATNVRLGFLGMLEMMDRPGPPATLDECLWLDRFTPIGSSHPRYIVAFRVPGMLKTPSSFSR